MLQQKYSKIGLIKNLINYTLEITLTALYLYLWIILYNLRVLTLNSNKVQKLVIAYKTSDRKARDSIITDIIKEYQSIIHNHSKGIAHDDLDEFKSLCNYELCVCLDNYNLDTKAKFVTYFYHFINSVRKKYYSKNSTRCFTYKDAPFDDTGILDFSIDKEKILNEYNTKLYHILCTKRIKVKRKDLKLLSTLRTYFYV